MTQTPEPGTFVIIEHPALFDRYVVARVAKVGKVMWDVQQLDHRGELCTMQRRKVTGWQVVAGDPVVTRERLVSAHAEFEQSVHRARKSYVATVRKIAEKAA